MFRSTPRSLSLVFISMCAAVVLSARSAGAVAVNFTLPAENSMPNFGTVPYPSDLYFDQGEPADGNGTLLNTGANIGLASVVPNANFRPTIERGLDILDGFGVT